MSDNIKVVVKVRPLISREIEDKQACQWRVSNNTLYQLDSNGRDFGQVFTFDKVYSEDTKTSDVYKDVAKPIVEAATAGFNGTIFAYGQTSSGKTYTMTGTEDSPGIIPLAVLNLFQIIKSIPDRDFLVRVSYIEIYNETVKDLLDIKKENLKIYETYDGTIKVDATEQVTSSPEEVLGFMKQGEANRQTGATNMNEMSSRSHSIFQITIESREHVEGEEQTGCVNVSQLNLVDLAGSERAGQTGATGLRFKEGTHINKSLSVLALVIKQLSDGHKKHANYRDSRLTRLLQNSLGGNAKTSIICAITPAALEETISTLQFATRAKSVKNKPEVNAVVEADKTMIQSLTKQLSKLQTELQSKKNLEVMLETKKHVELDLQKQIANLQKLILNGFGRRQSLEHISGTRRQPPRRQTISTIHSTSDQPSPDLPRFCTPHLKYNAMTVPNPNDFVPIQSTCNKLPSLPEEPPRLITPPPSNKRVQFNVKEGDIIEIDSDDDDNASTTTCSPYHSCYNKSKTPPCVLRRNAKEAEKNYNEIIKFTEREKMFEPTVVELMQKLELSTDMMTKLHDEIEALNMTSKQKDLEMEHLNCKIKKTEEELKKSKLELDTCSQQYKTKLTDLEVSYETLQKKAKMREDDLLSLLENQNVKKCQEIGKPAQKNLDNIPFIDISYADMSLVNSDNETSIIKANDDTSDKMQNLVATLQDQLINKGQLILQLEADIASQKKSIELLEQSSNELQKSVDEITAKASNLEDENKLLRSDVETLNSTIKCQKEHLETTQSDRDSYKSLIQELQIKLSNREHLLSMNITDSTLETMIANEEKALANNENMKNIIYCFKKALDNRTKEVEELKSSICNMSQDKISIEEHIEKTKQIDALNEEILTFKSQINENISTINNLIQEKRNLTLAEQKLTEKLSEVVLQKNELYELNKENSIQIQNLKEIIDKNQNLLLAKEQEHFNLNNQIEMMSSKIIEIEKDITVKNDFLSALDNHNKDQEDYELKAKSAVVKLQDIISILSGEVKEIPDLLDDMITLFNTMLIGLNTLEQVANNTVSEKNSIMQENTQLKSDISKIHDKHNNEISFLQHELEMNKKSVDSHLTEIMQLKDVNNKQAEDLIAMRKELEIVKVSENNLKDKLVALKQDGDILVQKSLKTDELKGVISDKNAEIANLEHQLNALSQEKESICNSIITKIFDIMSEFNIEMAREDITEINLECILEVFDKFVNVIINNESVNAENIATIQNLLQNFKQETATLTAENNTLKDKLSEMEHENKKITIELEKKFIDDKNMNDNLILSNSLLEQLKEDLNLKAAEIKSMECKAKEWKDQFTHLDGIMKEEMKYLQLENEKLKSRMEEINGETNKIDTLMNECDDSGFKEEQRSKAVEEPKDVGKTTSPSSLLTICCNTIIETLEPKHIDNNSDTSSSESECRNNPKCTSCEQLSLELRYSKQEISTLTTIIEQLELAKKDLLEEQQEVRREVQLLLEPVQELHKKIAGHKTNLSILTATTYAENRLLKSQVKSLQHHHNRFHNVCARDIPEFKSKLNDLLNLLKTDSTFSELQNTNTKLYSLPDVSEHFKNESTLDGDLLMLDTNVTLTTTGDNTLVGCDQICLDITQTYNEVSCQTNDIERSDGHNQMSGIEESGIVTDSQHNNIMMLQKLELLRVENNKLKEIVDRLTINAHKVNAITSPIKIPNTTSELCARCAETDISSIDITEIKRLTQIVTQIQTEKDDLEAKYNDLLLEIPDTDKLVSKIKDLEKLCNDKTNELTKMNSILNNILKELKVLQEENDSLSTQVMENISEADDLNKELDKLKTHNLELIEKIEKLEAGVIVTEDSKSGFNQVVISDIKTSPHTKLNRSLSDSNSCTTYNKICTLQNELHAGREDCKGLTEDVATIKQHLDCSNMSVDLNDTIESEKISKNLVIPNTESQCHTMPHIQEEQMLDVYVVDKTDCSNYYREITGIEENLPSDIKIIDIMRMLYDNLVTKHGNDVENLLNKLRDHEELKIKLQKQIDDMTSEYTTIAETVEKKEKNLNIVAKMIHQLKNDIKKINLQTSNPKDREELKEIANMLKQKVLTTFDFEFGICCGNIFDVIIKKYDEELLNIENQCTLLKSQNESLTSQLETANCSLKELKDQLVEKEKEYDLVNAQKLKLHEISGAVTLDIVKRDQEINNILSESKQKLLELKIISNDPELIGPVAQNLETMMKEIINQNKLGISKTQEYVSETLDLKAEIQSLKDINNNLNKDLIDKDLKVRELESQYNELNKSHNNMTQENTKNLSVIDQLTAEINTKTSNLEIIKDLEENNEKLKLMNQMILKEKEAYAIDLEKASETIKQNNTELGKMTSDILILRESTKEATSIIESMKQEVQKLSQENSELKQNFEEKCRECSKLDTHIKTYDKSAEIQNRMIKRLKKVKEDDDLMLNEKQTRIEEISQKCMELQNECQQLQDVLTSTQEEMVTLKTAKEVLEIRVAELEEAVNKRLSIDGIADSSRRRRQSLQDSKRILGDLDEHKNLEEVFASCQKHDDLFMDVDGDDHSGRSTPFGLGRGRDSLLSRTDQSDKGSEPPSRPGSVAASSRRRRQSTHDALRGFDANHDQSGVISHSRDTSITHGDDVTQLKEQLASVSQELEELKEKYRELDEECEICGQYLQERDQRCVQLKKENIALEAQLKEFKEKLQSGEVSSSDQLKSVAHVAVNTDEDWTNLHSVVVDRMSFDAEVEKNKKLKRTVEELRFKNQDLKNTIAKMQKALDKNCSKDTKELEATKEELETVKAELQELKINYKTLDEECETCAQYLRDSEDQCRKLREAKTVLENKLQKLQEESHASLTHSVRKKRQTVHDMHRDSSVDQHDASTETTDELLNCQVERDVSNRKASNETQREIKLLKMTVEKLSHQKAAMEQQLRVQAPNPVYVATGSAIVQNQQLSDVMRENHRLKIKNQKLATLCKRLTKNDSNRENEDPCQQR